MPADMDPYRILGLGRTAGAADIKAAYRRLSKSAHPDTGGDRAAFERLRAAYDVLRDPEARAHYDATGEIRAKGPDNAHAQAMSCLAASFDAVLAAVVKNGQDPAKTDMIGEIHRHLEAGIHHRARERERLAANRPGWEDMRNRFTVEDGKPNSLAAIVTAKLAQIDQMEARFAEGDRLARAALELLAGHRYLYDSDVMTWGNNIRFATSSTAWGG